MLDDAAITQIVKEAKTIAVYGMQDEKKKTGPPTRFPLC